MCMQRERACCDAQTAQQGRCDCTQLDMHDKVQVALEKHVLSQCNAPQWLALHRARPLPGRVTPSTHLVDDAVEVDGGCSLAVH